MKKYSDRPWHEFHLSRGQWYQLQAEKYSNYYEAQKAIAGHRLKLLEKLGYCYNADRNEYIKVEDGTTLWT